MLLIGAIVNAWQGLPLSVRKWVSLALQVLLTLGAIFFLVLFALPPKGDELTNQQVLDDDNRLFITCAAILIAPVLLVQGRRLWRGRRSQRSAEVP